MAYDRADWHYGGDYPEDLPPENGGTHIGMFLAWAIMNGLEGKFHREESPPSLAAVRARQLTGCQFLFKECDEKFGNKDLSAEGNAFAKYYYDGTEGQGGPYFEDYESALVGDLPSMYHVEDSWQNYDKIAPVISQRFEEWNAKDDALPCAAANPALALRLRATRPVGRGRWKPFAFPSPRLQVPSSPRPSRDDVFDQ